MYQVGKFYLEVMNHILRPVILFLHDDHITSSSISYLLIVFGKDSTDNT